MKTSTLGTNPKCAYQTPESSTCFQHWYFPMETVPKTVGPVLNKQGTFHPFANSELCAGGNWRYSLSPHNGSDWCSKSIWLLVLIAIGATPRLLALWVEARKAVRLGTYILLSRCSLFGTGEADTAESSTDITIVNSIRDYWVPFPISSADFKNDKLPKQKNVSSIEYKLLIGRNTSFQYTINELFIKTK